MNLQKQLSVPFNLIYKFGINVRRLLPKSKTSTFVKTNSLIHPKIEYIYVINLDREKNRWTDLRCELKNILIDHDSDLLSITERFSAIDAKNIEQITINKSEVDTVYTLGEQLFVEPQPLASPTDFNLKESIDMSRPEIAIALSHIGIWQKIISGNHNHVLILEDDVLFRYGFAKQLDKVWSEIVKNKKIMFDILYLSYEEVKYGAPKNFISPNVFCPDRGLWHMSGYVLSKKGATKLLNMLPCRGPVDLWINHKFKDLNVIACRHSIISQRRNLKSTNSYSVLPSLTKIGAITSESASLFQKCHGATPVFGFGTQSSGLSSLALALSMLGYKCCSDLQDLPRTEKFLMGKKELTFNAYINIKSLENNIYRLKELFPNAKFIVTRKSNDLDNEIYKNILKQLNNSDFIILLLETSEKWNFICRHLHCSPPPCSYPNINENGQRQLQLSSLDKTLIQNNKAHKWDKTPWVIDSNYNWSGLHLLPNGGNSVENLKRFSFIDNFSKIDSRRWFSRDDTFTDNNALFRSSNIELLNHGGFSLYIRKESLGVRDYSAAAISSIDQFLYGRFEARVKASKVPGVVTGFFLHRDSPIQEIDIEITGNKTDKLLANVFYNPGVEGDKFDYGYRGTAISIDLGFDASESEHSYAIEWNPNEISWFVDNCLVHKRVEWNPTPIPYLPMTLHVNSWPSCSKELVGKLNDKLLPSVSLVKSININANLKRSINNYEYSCL